MKVENSRKAIRRYDLVHCPGDNPKRPPEEPAIPDEPGVVHALLYERAGYSARELSAIREVTFRLASDYRPAFDAACGASVRVAFPMRFDTSEPEACPRCAELSILRLTDPRAYSRRRELERERRREMAYEDDLEAFYERQRRELAAQERLRRHAQIEVDRRTGGGMAG